jgi:hypothetical protein
MSDVAPSGDGIDPEGVRDAAGLLQLLKQLWIIAGEPSLRQVESQSTHLTGKLPHTNLSRAVLHRSTLSQVLNGRTFPAKAFYLTFVEVCGRDLGEDRRWERAWDVVKLAGGDAVTQPETQDVVISPAVAELTDAAIVSCDIVDHAAATDVEQIRNVNAINRIVAELIGAVDPTAVWASGGDGGHVVFRSPEWLSPAVRLMTALHEWSVQDNTSVRITAHYGPVYPTAGADQRTQFVGAGINTAGRVLAIGIPTGLLVSAEFKAAYEHAKGRELRFHSSRALIGKKYEEVRVYLASTDTVRSTWPEPVDRDRANLTDALEKGDSWAILRCTKRIMQVNPHDPDAVNAVHQVFPGGLSTTGPKGEIRLNPLLSQLKPTVLHEVLQLGELVERQRDDVICRYGDRGDSMFIVLSGRLGVAESEGRDDDSVPEVVLNIGDIAGELAFVLERPRTAGLVALTDVVLLSLRAADVFERLSSRAFQASRDALEKFVTARVLEHITYNAPYLIGKDGKGPLVAGHRPIAHALDALAVGSQLITLNPLDLQLTFERVAGKESGLYILASGEASGVVANGGIFPVLWARVPGVLDKTSYQYTLVNDPVKILHIGGGALADLEPAKRAALYAALSGMRFPGED